MDLDSPPKAKRQRALLREHADGTRGPPASLMVYSREHLVADQREAVPLAQGREGVEFAGGQAGSGRIVRADHQESPGSGA